MFFIAIDDGSDSFKSFALDGEFDFDSLAGYEESSLSESTWEILSKSDEAVSSKPPNISLMGDAACVESPVDNIKELSTYPDMDKHLKGKSDMPDMKRFSPDELLKEYFQKSDAGIVAMQKYAFTKIWVEQQQNNFLNNHSEEYKFAKALDEYFMEEKNTKPFSLLTCNKT